jgi:hypothetical protein
VRTTYALSTVGILAASTGVLAAGKQLPSHKQVEFAIAVMDACVDPDGYTNCIPGTIITKREHCVSVAVEKSNDFPARDATASARCTYKWAFVPANSRAARAKVREWSDGDTVLYRQPPEECDAEDRRDKDFNYACFPHWVARKAI